MVTVAKKNTTPSAKAKTTARPSAKRPANATLASAPRQATAAEAGLAKTDKKKAKHDKVKVVRDSFTIPKTEYTQIAALKKRALSLGLDTKKSELIRAGLALLSAASDPALRKALDRVPTLKTGRPGKA